MEQELHDIFGTTGDLAKAIPGFNVRAVQQAMAEAVAKAIAAGSQLICEAGTGTGKTFAYLVPALLAHKRVIVSTATKNLQDQLFQKDIPVLQKALQNPLDVVLLKGRSNYLCLHRFENAKAEGTRSRDRQQAYVLIDKWQQRTEQGDIAELPALSENAPVWGEVTSTAENCLRQECKFYEDCYVIKARRAAQTADMVVVNHHLLLSDMVLRDQNFGELLPTADVLIMDEAHQLPKIANQYFGTSVSSRQIHDLVQDTLRAYVLEAQDMPGLREACYALETESQRARLDLATDSAKESLSGQATSDHLVSLRALLNAVNTVKDTLELCESRGRELKNCFERAQMLSSRLTAYLDETHAANVKWWERRQRSFVLHNTPLSIAEDFRARLERYPCASILVSATLSVRGNFDYFQQQLGLQDAETLCLDSVFDYANQAVLYLPELECDPNDPGYTKQVVAAALPLLKASRGRAFMLFTSHRALSEAHALLENHTEFTLFKQGEAPRSRLLEEFRVAEHAVLLGTSSFWEGVDVRGEALSCVIIDKLPFMSVHEPLVKARIKYFEEQGQNAFREYQLPEAVIALKQGAGRLIRDEKDTGVLMIADPRVTRANYGKVFVDSLPPMHCSRSQEDVVDFFTTKAPRLNP